MRKLLIIAAVMAMTVATVSDAEAGRRQRRRYTRTRTMYQRAGQYQRTEPRQGLFARLIEFERRKNAFLFGR